MAASRRDTKLHGQNSRPCSSGDGWRGFLLSDQLDAAASPAELNQLEVQLWLDGPAGPSGRVGGAARSLLLTMNAVVLANDVDEDAGASGLDAWSRIEEIDLPATVACGDLDLPHLIAQSAELADRLPQGRHVTLPGLAHLPHLEQPEAIASVIAEAVGL